MNIIKNLKLAIKKTPSIFALILFAINVSADTRVYKIDADDWARPRSGQILIEYPELRALIADWNTRSEDVIEIYYPGGDMGNLWSLELSDWLVSLGVPSHKLRRLAGSAAIDKIELIIVQQQR